LLPTVDFVVLWRKPWLAWKAPCLCWTRRLPILVLSEQILALLWCLLYQVLLPFLPLQVFHCCQPACLSFFLGWRPGLGSVFSRSK
jgi:hypothetical protein